MKIAGYKILIVLILLISISCEKPEGVGGDSSITGKVVIDVYDKQYKVLQASYPAPDENVYIIYGDNEEVSDETATSYNGIFKFQYLTKGNYQLFVYSDDITTNSLIDVKIDTIVELSDNKSQVDIGELKIYKTIDYDDGYASISGKVLQVNYSKDFIYIIDTTKAQEVDVYLVYENTFIDRVRTLQDGSFCFSNLLKGNYSVIVYSEDLNGGVEMIAKTKTTTINTVNEKIDLGTLFIDKED